MGHIPSRALGRGAAGARHAQVARRAARAAAADATGATRAAGGRKALPVGGRKAAADRRTP